MTEADEYFPRGKAPGTEKSARAEPVSRGKKHELSLFKVKNFGKIAVLLNYFISFITCIVLQQLNQLI